MPNLKLGVICRTRKENEHRLPIHPDHFDRIDADLRANIYLEHGYGEHFGVSDASCRPWSAGMRSRERVDRRVRRHPADQARRAAISPNCVSARCCGAGRTASRIGS